MVTYTYFTILPKRGVLGMGGGYVWWGLAMNRGARSKMHAWGLKKQIFYLALRHGSEKENFSANRSSRNYPSMAILSSRVLLVSNLRRSNQMCTVKRFFKSTVMLLHSCVRKAVSHSRTQALVLIAARFQCSLS